MPDLEPISKEQLYTEKEQLHTENIALKEQVTHLQFQLSQVNRLLFGQKRERFEPTQAVQQATLFSLQGSLQEENAVANPAGQVNTEIVKKKGQIAGKPNPNHPGRNQFPAHLPRVVEILTPEAVSDNPEGYRKIGQEVTETLDYTPAKLFVKQYKPTKVL